MATALSVSQILSHSLIGYVFKAADSATGVPVAIKRSQKVGSKVSREFEVLSELRGKPNLIQLVDFFYSLDSKERLIQNSVFEFCDKNLEDILKEMEKMPPGSHIPLPDIKRYIKEILNGLHHMHQLRIVHRDLKPENILLKNGQVKICDFGSSKFIDEERFKNTPYVVSRYYRAPELILAATKYNEAIDIWAVGCILFELLTRTPLFPGDTEGLQILEQSCVLGSPTDSDFEKLTELVEPKVLNLLKKATMVPKLDLPKVFKKEWYGDEEVKMAADLVDKMLRWVPAERVSAMDAMNHSFLASTIINQ